MTDDGDGAVLLGGEGASEALAQRAPVFAPLVERFGPARVEADRDPFAALVEAVVSQQLSVQAAATVHGELVDAVGGEVTPATVAAADPEALRAAGLSGRKVEYVRGIADAARDGALPLDALPDLPDDEVLEVLTGLRGVGPWTARMLLIFTLHRPDVLPVGDLGVRDGARRVLELDDVPEPDELRDLADPWRPYRSVASWYLWRERDRQLQVEGER